MEKGIPLLILTMYLNDCVSSASSEYHFHRIMFTYSTGNHDIKALTFVDEHQITHYDSHSETLSSSGGWLRASLNESWKNYKDFCTSSYMKLKNELNSFFTGQKKDVQIFQWLSYLKWYNGTADCEGYERYAWNGEDVISLDVKRMIYINHTEEAARITDKWNKQRRWIDIVRRYYTKEFPAYIKKIAPYLQKTVTPEVYLWQRNSSSPVVCLATGFNPRPLKITWQKNGEDYNETVEEGETLPNVDETFQKKSFLRVKPEEWKKNQYSCVVQHKSVNGSIIKNVKMSEPGRGPIWKRVLPTGIALILFFIVLLVFGIFIKVEKKKRDSGCDCTKELENKQDSMENEANDTGKPVYMTTFTAENVYI